MLALILAIAAAYAGVKIYLDKQEEKEKQSQKAYAVTDFKASEITAFSCTRDGQTWSYEKNGEEWNSVESPETDLSEEDMESMLEAAAQLFASEELTEYASLADYGLDEPSAAFSFQTADGIITLYAGNQNEITGTYYLKREDRESVYVVDSDLSAALFVAPKELEAADSEAAEATENADSETLEGTEETDSKAAEDTENRNSGTEEAGQS